MAAVNLVDVCKTVGSTRILNNIHLGINTGEFLVVVGPSGCGKSTLLRLIAGLDTVSSGKILINNQCVNNIPAAKRDMAMVFQQYALYPHMTVFDNMAYGLKMRRVGREEIKERVHTTATLLQLTALLDRKPQALSGGQKQRVAMGRAIVRNPAVFLFDEPLSNLDTNLRTQMRHEIKKLHQQFNTTCLYVTHDHTEAMTMAERVLVLNHGLIEQVGTPRHLYQAPGSVFVAGFTGHYPMNFIQGHVDKAAAVIHTALGRYPLPACAQAQADKTPVVVGIRPEHIQLASAATPHAIAVLVDLVDDMGDYRLVQTVCAKNGQRLDLRLLSEVALSDGHLYLDFPHTKLHLFDQATGNRLGGFSA